MLLSVGDRNFDGLCFNFCHAHEDLMLLAQEGKLRVIKAVIGCHQTHHLTDGGNTLARSGGCTGSGPSPNCSLLSHCMGPLYFPSRAPVGSSSLYIEVLVHVPLTSSAVNM
jgi:hypothetical protein